MNNRTLVLESELLVGNDEVVVELTPAEVAKLALEIGLLLCSLADRIRLSGHRGARVELVVGPETKATAATVNQVQDHMLRFELGRNQAENIQSVLLRAFRDGQAEVSHIHVSGVKQAQPLDLTFLFECYRSPLSAAEAAKQLDS